MAKAAKQKRQIPLMEGYPQAELVATIVDNPNYSRAYDGDKTNPRKTPAIMNARESAISTLAARGLLDTAQVEAAVKFRALFETLGGKGARAIDYSREFVDGGRFPEPIGTHQIDAGKKLALAYDVLTKAHGLYAWKLVGYICGEGRSVYELTETRRQRDTMTDRLRDALDVLAIHWGFSNRPQVMRGPNAEHRV